MISDDEGRSPRILNFVDFPFFDCVLMFFAVIFQFMQRMSRLKTMRVSPLTKMTAGETRTRMRMKMMVRVSLLVHAIKFFAAFGFFNSRGFDGSVVLRVSGVWMIQLGFLCFALGH